MSFTRYHSPIRYDYLVDGIRLRFSSSNVVDLGVTFDCTQFFKSALLCFCSFPPGYGVVIWDPQTTMTLVKLSMFTFFKYAYFAAPRIDCLPNDYTPVQEKLNLETSSARRINANLVFFLKLISEEVDAPDMLARIHFNVQGANLCNFSVFQVPFCETNYLCIEHVLRMTKLANGTHHL
ncbi:hypothetical protein QTP88_005797 [Uroleucon formosanum]